MPETAASRDRPANVGIIVPAYNYGRYLDDCLGSVAAQTHTDFTVLIIDNASTDDTRTIAERWAARDARFRYVRNATNIGLGGSLLKAYALLDNPLMMMLSADDSIAPTFLEHTAGALARHPECVLAYTRWEAVFDRPDDARHGQRSQPFIPHQRSGVFDETAVLLSHNWITNSICLWRRAVCDVVGAFDAEGLRHVGDWHLYLRLLSEGPAYYINDVLGFYRLHGEAESDRLRGDKLSGPDHIRFYDLISTSERWPLTIRCLAKAHQIRWLTGEPLMGIVHKLGGPQAHPVIREMMENVRHDVTIGAARAVLEYTPGPNALDTPQSAFAAIDAVLAEAPEHAGARALRTEHSAPAGQPAAPRAAAQTDFVRRCLAADLARHAPTPRISVVVDARAGGPLRRTLRSLRRQVLGAAHIVLLDAPAQLAEPHCQRIDASDLPAWQAAHCHDAGHWMLGLIAGDALAEDALYHCARAIEQQPDARIVYTDHDEIGRDDVAANPHYKPDANPELLRSTPYIGRALVVRGDHLADHPAPLELVASHVLALRALEVGDSALAHVPALLMHLDVRSAPTTPADAEQAAALAAQVHRHAACSAPGTVVIDGPGAGQFAWLPPLDRTPPVSIIVPTKDRIDLLGRCLDTLLEATRYPAFEVIVVDNESETPEARAYLDALASGREPRVRVLRHPGAFNFSAMNNRAVDIATGDYVLLLNNDTEVIDPDWLGTLMRHAQRDTVGVVGPMLYFPDGRIQHAGVVMGMFGPADHPFSGLPGDTPGYLSRARLQQNYSAVTGACLLTPKALYQQLGGLDETRFAVSYNDIDYCLRVRALGKQVVWTPLARLQHVGSASQHSDTEKLVQGARQTRFNAEREAMYRRWSACIAQDPAYNVNLSLATLDARPEREPLLRFDPLAACCPQRVLALLGSTARASRYRILEPLATLKAVALASGGVLRAPLDANQVLRSGADTLILQLPRAQREVATQRALLALPGITTVFDGDDLLRDNPYVEAEAADPVAALPAPITELLAAVDRIVVSNPRLGERLAAVNPAVHVVPDALNPAIWVDPPAPAAPRDGRRPRVGWIAEHADDADVLATLVATLGAEVEFMCVGPCPSHIGAAVTRVDLPPDAAYPQALAALGWDVALIPLPAGPAGDWRSPIHALEAGWCGVPVVCSDAPPHAGALPLIRVADTPDAWLTALRALLADAPARLAAGRALQQAVLAQMEHAADYRARWQRAWACPARAPGDPLLTDAATAVPALFDALVGGIARVDAPTLPAPAPPPRAETPARTPTPTDDAAAKHDAKRDARRERRTRATAQRSPDAVSADLDASYALFLTRRVQLPSDLQFLERATARWSGMPVVHILTEARDSEFELLSNTLDSLGAQPYSLWSLSILADTPCPDPAIGELPNIDWLHRTDATEPAKAAFDAIVAERACDVVVYLPPGAELDPLCLWRVAHEFATRPQWMALYTDDDVIRIDGNRVEPRFKPDLCVDFLRSCDYVGALWARAEVYRRAGGFAAHASTRFYDFTLRVLDAVGADAIGHVADPLLSLPVSPAVLISDRDAHAALAAHLTRNAAEHTIRPGALHATWRVEYQHDTQPRVDIVLAYRNRLEFVEPAVDSLFHHTRWPDFRLILVDNGSDDPDCAQWAERLQQQHGERVLRCALGGEWNRAAAFNHGAAHSDAAYILFLHHDVQFLAAHWLERLMSHAMRPDVAAVAPRQARPGDGTLDFSGSVFGLPPGIGAPETDETPLDYPGYLGRLQTDQNYHLLNSACLLTRRSAFDAAGGFDPAFGLIGAESDLSARLRAQGRLVWTPWVTIAHYNDDSPPLEGRSEDACIAEMARLQAALGGQRNALVARYVAPLGRDGAWNPNLRLSCEDVRVEAGCAVEWHAIPADVPRIVADPVTGAGEFRAIAPLRAARRAGKAQAAIFRPPSLDVRRMSSAMDLARLEGVDSYIVHNPAVSEQVTLLRQMRTHVPDVLIVAALDDLTTAVPCDSDVFTQWTRETRTHMRRCLAQCHRLVVSTEPLVDFARHMIDDIRVVPNRVEWARWEGLESKRRTGSKPRVGWAGAQQHAGDLALIETVVKHTHTEVDWIFFGMCPPALAPYVREAYGWVDFERYPATLAGLNLDLAVAPLEINPFNEAKSNLRLLDYGILGWPVVCTDIEPYRGAPVTRVNNSSQEWIEAIRAHVHDLDAAERAGDALREWVKADYILEDHVDDWLKHHLP